MKRTAYTKRPTKNNKGHAPVYWKHRLTCATGKMIYSRKAKKKRKAVLFSGIPMGEYKLPPFLTSIHECLKAGGTIRVGHFVDAGYKEVAVMKGATIGKTAKAAFPTVETVLNELSPIKHPKPVFVVGQALTVTGMGQFDGKFTVDAIIGNSVSLKRQIELCELCGHPLELCNCELNPNATE